jgi:hypothetical protein
MNITMFFRFGIKSLTPLFLAVGLTALTFAQKTPGAVTVTIGDLGRSQISQRL